MKIKGKQARRILAISLCLVLTWNLLQTTGFIQDFYTVMAATTAQITPGMTNVNVRQGPSTLDRILTKVQGGQALTVLDQPNSQWYHVQFTQGGTAYTGYVHADYVSIINTGTPDPGPSGDSDFESYLSAQGFPETYKPYLRSLHAKHPEWKFVAMQTGLDWNTVIENERNKPGQIKNLIWTSGSAPHYNWRETEVGYSWVADTWYPYDGTNWFAASRDIVAYYMDPRGYLDETYIFAFEQLSYDPAIHNQAGVEAILAGTFMANACPVNDNRTYSAILMEAAAAYNVSPYHLASRMRQEMGTTAGENATGTSPNYPGIFNFFNVGSVDSADGGAVNKGLAWASISGSYGRPWNSAYKAIMGGSQFIGSSYINRGQDTLYTQKFNVTSTGTYGHQYMTNVQAPSTESSSICRAYKANGLINSALVFKIPVYLNMPEGTAGKPADSGSPNNWLRSLEVSGYALTPSFDGGVIEYSLIVGNETGSVNVTAAAVNGNARIQGTGTISLSVGTNRIPITVTAQNGSIRTYNLTIVRKDSGGGVPGVTTKFHIEGNRLSGIGAGMNADAVAAGITGGNVTVYHSDGTTINAGTVGTGNIVTVSDGTSTVSYTVIIYGDVLGNGSIGVGDLVVTKKSLLGLGQLSSAQTTAADVDRDGDVTIRDLVMIKKHILGQQSLLQ